jgi:NtrC-family two-component system sensor histidine kinase KinB
MKLIPRSIRTSIQSKLFLSFLIVLLLLVAEVYVSFLTISSLGRASQQILEMNYNSIIASIEMMDNLDTIQREYIFLETGPSDQDPRDLYAAQSNFAQWLGKAKNNITETGEVNILAELDSFYNDYIESLQRELALEGNSKLRIESLEAKRSELRTQCFKLLEVNQAAMFEKSDKARLISLRGTLTLTLVTVLVLVLGVVLSWGLSKRIVRPILTLKEATKSLALGNYAIELHHEGEDELGILTDEFSQMAAKLRELNELNLRNAIAEQQKRGVILSSIQEGIFFITEDYRIMDANSAALTALNLAREDVVGHHFLEVIKQEALFEDLKSCLETRSTILFENHDNYIVQRREGKQFYLEYFFTPVLTDTQDLLGAVFLLRDITKLKELDRLKSEFVMIVSHELKTPLTSINMSIDLLKESLGSSPKDSDLELIDIAKEEINRLRMLVNDLLDLSKIEAGKIEMRFAPAQPITIMDSVFQYFRSQAAEKSIELERQLPVPDCSVWCDEEKLMHVFSNLVSNALKAVGDNGKITLSAEETGNFVLFCVRDNGIGIPLAYQNRIFDRFVQVDEQNAVRGTGLGLTISREIVRAHGGTIWVESSPGQGAAFYFTIPIESKTTKPTLGA